jgi:hypothetical protein
MIDFTSTPVVIGAAGLATAGLALVLKVCSPKPKRPEKWEKAQIMKQLLALAEQDPGLATAPSVRLRAPASKPTGRAAYPHLKASTRTTLPPRSKAR